VLCLNVCESELEIVEITLFGKAEAMSEVNHTLKVIGGVEAVSIFENLFCAKEHLAEQSSALLLLDGDDEDVCWQYLVEELQGCGPEVRIVLLKEDSYDAVKAYDVGVFDYLLKPVDEKQLIRVMVKYMLNQKNLVKLEKSER